MPLASGQVSYAILQPLRQARQIQHQMVRQRQVVRWQAIRQQSFPPPVIQLRAFLQQSIQVQLLQMGSIPQHVIRLQAIHQLAHRRWLVQPGHFSHPRCGSGCFSHRRRRFPCP